MKKKLTLFSAFLVLSIAASAQKVYKLAKSSGKLNLNISGAKVEGYNGNEIIFTIPNAGEDQVDERAKGLTPLNSSGFKDNSGIGLDVAVKGDDVIVNPVSIANQAMVSIKLPQAMKLSFTNNNMSYQDTLSIRNVKTEIDVSVAGNDVILVDNVGPMNIKTLHGSIDAKFSNEIKGPISIVSVHGHVDVAVPATIKANLDVLSNYGKIYAAESLNIAVSPSQRTESISRTISVATSGIKTGSALTITSNPATPPMPPTPPNPGEINVNGIVVSGFGSRRDSEVLKGKINGGGIDILLKSSHENIYIRKN